MYVSVVFSIFAEMCSHHHHLLLDYFYDHKRNCMPSSSQLPLSPLNSPLLLLLLWFNRSVLSGSWWPHELQRTRLLSLFHCLPEFAQTHVHWDSDAIQPSHPLWPPFPLALNFFSIQIFSSELALQIRWPKSWSFNVSASSKYSVLISFRIDWFDLLAAQGTLRSLCQHRSLKESILMGISYKWNHIICDLLCLDYFIAYDF